LVDKFSIQRFAAFVFDKYFWQYYWIMISFLFG
jgi:hypothetical protein